MKNKANSRLERNKIGRQKKVAEFDILRAFNKSQKVEKENLRGQKGERYPRSVFGGILSMRVSVLGE